MDLRFLLRTSLALFGALAASTVPFDFENGLEGWTLSSGEKMSAVSSEAAHGGKAGLRVTDADEKTGSSIASPKVPVKAGDPIALSFWGRLVDGQGLGVYLRFFDAKGKSLSQSTTWLDKDAWKLYRASQKAPEGAASVDVWIHSGNALLLTGDVDDIVLTVGEAATAAAPKRNETGADGGLVLRPSHPRLLITSSDEWLAIAKRLDGYGKNGAELRSRLRVMADQAVRAPLIKPPPPAGSKSDWLSESRNAQKRLLCLAVAYRLDGDEAYLKRAVDEAKLACGYENWFPDHFLDTGEMALTISLVYDWLYDKLSPDDRAALRDGLERNALSFAKDVYGEIDLENPPADKRLWWKNRKSNWSQVCHTGLLAAALALAEDDVDRAKMVARGVAAYLPISMKAYDPEGAYPEGPGYWGYGTTYNVLALTLLESATGGDLGLGKVVEGFGKTAPYRLHMDGPFRLIYNYADVLTSWEDAISPAYAWLGKRYGQDICVEHAWSRMENEFAERPASKEGNRFFAYYFFWLPPRPSSTPKPLSLDAHYPGEADVAVFRSKWNDTNAVYLGFKAGLNGAGHGHQDLGSFLLDAEGVRWSVELGSDNYGLPDYFGRKRDGYFRLNNQGHSTLNFGSLIQKRGEGKIAHFESGEKRSGAIADLAVANPEAASGWKRGVWLLDRSRVLIQDEIEGLVDGTDLHGNMITAAEVEIAQDGRRATLRQQGKTLIAEILEPAEASFDVIDAKPPTGIENPNTGFRILRANLTGASGKVRMAVRLTPGSAPTAKDAWIPMDVAKR